MGKNRDPHSAGNGDYVVGYGRPPKHSQFAPGQSGNPAGRRNRVRNLKTDVMRTLAEPIKVKQGGRTRTRSTQEGALMRLREKALSGDARALDRFLELAFRFNNDIAEGNSTQSISADDEAILAAYVAEANAVPAVSAPAEPLEDRHSKENNKADGKDQK